MKRLIKNGVYTEAGNDISAEFKSNVIVLLRGYLEKYDAIDVEHILVNTLRGIFSMERLKFVDDANSTDIKSKPVFASDGEYKAFKKEFCENVQKAHSEQVELRRKHYNAWRRKEAEKTFWNSRSGQKLAHEVMLDARQSGKTKLKTVLQEQFQKQVMDEASGAYVNQDGCVKDKCEKGKCKTCLHKNLQELHNSIGKHMSDEPSYAPDNFQDVIDDILWDKKKPSCAVMDECVDVDKSQWVEVDDSIEKHLNKVDVLKKIIHNKT